MRSKFLIVSALSAAGAVLLSQAAVGGTPAEKPGAAIYRQRCQSCHGVPGKRSTLAPSLVGIVGRRAASTAFNYSPALKRSAIVWDRTNLERFIAAPGRTVPGTRMVIGLTDAKQRTDMIEYLAGLR